MNQAEYRHFILLAKGWYLEHNYSLAIMKIAERILGKKDIVLDDALGLLIRFTYGVIQNAGEPVKGETGTLEDGKLIGGSLYEFASMIKFTRNLAFNLDKTPSLTIVDEQGRVKGQWSELIIQALLLPIAHTIWPDDEMGEPDPSLMPINIKTAPKRKDKK